MRVVSITLIAASIPIKSHREDAERKKDQQTVLLIGGSYHALYMNSEFWSLADYHSFPINTKSNSEVK